MTRKTGWTKRPSAFVGRMKGDIDKIARRVAMIVLRELIIVSPRDTGRFVNNWVVGLGNSVETMTQKTDFSGSDSLYKGITRIKQQRSGRSIFISNNLPYAVRLNDGHSGQAPANFVESALNKGASE